MKNKIIVDSEITLEQLQPNDAERLFELTEQNREYLLEFLPWPEKTLAVEDSLSFILLMLEQRSLGKEYGYGIKYKGSLVGHTSLMHIDEGRPEIGYWLAAEYAGKGITTKVTRTLSNLALDSLAIETLLIRAEPANLASNRVAEKSGYVFSKFGTDNKGKKLNEWVYSK